MFAPHPSATTGRMSKLLASKRIDSSGNTVPFSSLMNGSSSCGFMVDFNHGGTAYKLLVGRLLNPTDPQPRSQRPRLLFS